MAIEPSSVDGAPLLTEILRLQNQVFPNVHRHNPITSQYSNAKKDDKSPLPCVIRHEQHEQRALIHRWKQSFREIHHTFKNPPRSPSPTKEFELKERLVI